MPVADAKDKIPLLATEFAQYHVAKYGLCGDVLHRAYSVYCQVIDGLPCEDEDNRARADDRFWLSQRRA